MLTAAVILNGGRSSRMGSDKSCLTIGNKTLIERAQDVLSETSIQDIFVSGNCTGNIHDITPGRGPLAGIHASLFSLIRFHQILFIPVDMPLLTTHVIISLLHQPHEHQLVHFKNFYFPLLIRNLPEVRHTVNHHIETEKLSIHQLLQALNTCVVAHSNPDRIFFNCNTPKDWLHINTTYK